MKTCLATLICVLAICAASSAETIGIIMTAKEATYNKAHESFVAYMTETGYSRNLKFVMQRPHPDPIAWSNAARKLISADVDIIVSYDAPPTLATLNEKPIIPVVFADIYEPLAQRLDRTRATGVCSKYSISSLIRYLKGTMHGRDVGLVYSSMEEDSLMQYAEIKEISEKYGLEVKAIDIKNPLDATGLISQSNASAFVISSSSIANSILPTLIRIAKLKKSPVASLVYNEESPPIIMMIPNAQALGKATAEKVIMILNKVKIKDIPMTCSDKIELIFNSAEARQMGFKIPMDLVTEATKIVY